MEAEYRDPKSQKRVAAGKMPQMWGQSLYVIGRLVKEGFVFPGELDPLNRRLGAEPRPDIVVQGAPRRLHLPNIIGVVGVVYAACM